MKDDSTQQQQKLNKKFFPHFECKIYLFPHSIDFNRFGGVLSDVYILCVGFFIFKEKHENVS